jgi:hypothetical protein
LINIVKTLLIDIVKTLLTSCYGRSTRAALSTGGRAKNQIPISYAKKRSLCLDWDDTGRDDRCRLRAVIKADDKESASDSVQAALP